MNDFTKEDLACLLAMTTIWCMSNPEDKIAPALRDKIGNIYDNYSKCNHKEIVTGAYSRSNPPKKCDICGSLYR